jgi:ribulose kinase
MRIHDCSLLGSIVIAGKAIGFYDDMIKAAGSINNIENTFVPDPMASEAYNSVYSNWERFRDDHYAALRGI